MGVLLIATNEEVELIKVCVLGGGGVYSWLRLGETNMERGRLIFCCFDCNLEVT